MRLKARVRQLERRIISPRSWFSLEVWRRETAAGVDLAEQERRRLAEHAEYSEAIQASFAQRRARLAAVAEIEGIEQTEVQSES